MRNLLAGLAWLLGGCCCLLPSDLHASIGEGVEQGLVAGLAYYYALRAVVAVQLMGFG